MGDSGADIYVLAHEENACRPGQVVLPEARESAPIYARLEQGHGRAGAKAVFCAKLGNGVCACGRLRLNRSYPSPG